MKVILASQSEPRKRALDILGITYETIPARIDEKDIRHENPLELVKQLSETKAKYVGNLSQDALVIAGDLVVYFKNKVYEKPTDKAEAMNMLRSFSGQWISIIGGVSVYNHTTGSIQTAVEEYKVLFRTLKEKEIQSYIARFPAMACAGAFEGNGLFWFAEKAKGEYPFMSQITFPMNKLITFLEKEGVL